MKPVTTVIAFIKGLINRIEGNRKVYFYYENSAGEYDGEVLKRKELVEKIEDFFRKAIDSVKNELCTRSLINIRTVEYNIYNSTFDNLINANKDSKYEEYVIKVLHRTAKGIEKEIGGDCVSEAEFYSRLSHYVTLGYSSHH